MSRLSDLIPTPPSAGFGRDGAIGGLARLFGSGTYNKSVAATHVFAPEKPTPAPHQPQLDYDTLGHVLSFLKTTEIAVTTGVDKQLWHRTSKTPSNREDTFRGSAAQLELALASHLRRNIKILKMSGAAMESPRLSSDEIDIGGLVHVLTTQEHTIHSVDVSQNRLELMGSTAIAKLIRSNKTITSLKLNGCDIGNGGFKVIAEALVENTTLKRLYLGRSNHLGHSALVDLADVLHRNGTIEYLDLYVGMSFHAVSLEHLRAALVVNNTLTHLGLYGCRPTSEGWSEVTTTIVAAIKSSKSIRSLDLRDNRLNDWSNNRRGQTLNADFNLIQVLTALGYNQTIAVVNIGSNEVEDRHMELTAWVVEHNRALVSLDLRGNLITLEGAKQLVPALLKNTRLKSLDLSRNRMSQSDVAALRAMLAGKKDFQLVG